MADPALKLEDSNTNHSAASPETVSLGSPGPLVKKAAQSIIDKIEDLHGLNIQTVAPTPADVADQIGAQIREKCARASLNTGQLEALTSYIGSLTHQYADEQGKVPLSAIITDKKPDTSDFKDFRIFMIDGEQAQAFVTNTRNVTLSISGTSTSQTLEIDPFAAFGRRFYLVIGVLSDAAIGKIEAQANAIDRLAEGNPELAEELKQALYDQTLGEDALALLDNLSELNTLLTEIQQGQAPEGFEARLAELTETINMQIQEGVQNGTLPAGLLQLSANALAALDQAVQGNADLRAQLSDVLGPGKLDALNAAVAEAAATLVRNGIVSTVVTLSPATLDALMELAESGDLDPDLSQQIQDMINEGEIGELIDLIANDAEIAAQIEQAAPDIAGDILGEVRVAAETRALQQQVQNTQALTDAITAALSEEGAIDGLKEAIENGSLDLGDLPPEVREALINALEAGDPGQIAQIIAGNDALAADVSAAAPDIVSPEALAQARTGDSPAQPSSSEASSQGYAATVIDISEALSKAAEGKGPAGKGAAGAAPENTVAFPGGEGGSSPNVLMQQIDAIVSAETKAGGTGPGQPAADSATAPTARENAITNLAGNVTDVLKNIEAGQPVTAEQAENALQSLDRMAEKIDPGARKAQIEAIRQKLADKVKTIPGIDPTVVNEKTPGCPPGCECGESFRNAVDIESMSNEQLQTFNKKLQDVQLSNKDHRLRANQDGSIEVIKTGSDGKTEVVERITKEDLQRDEEKTRQVIKDLEDRGYSDRTISASELESFISSMEDDHTNCLCHSFGGVNGQTGTSVLDILIEGTDEVQNNLSLDDMLENASQQSATKKLDEIAARKKSRTNNFEP